MRHVQNATKQVQFAVGHSDFSHSQQRIVLPQQTHDNRFAVQHRNDRDADIDIRGVEPDLDASVLGKAFFRYVQMTENLDTRNNGRLKALDLRWNRNFLEHAVNTVADAEFFFKRLKVDVRRAQFNGILQHLIDKADD